MDTLRFFLAAGPQQEFSGAQGARNALRPSTAHRAPRPRPTGRSPLRHRLDRLGRSLRESQGSPATFSTPSTPSTTTHSPESRTRAHTASAGRPPGPLGPPTIVVIAPANSSSRRWTAQHPGARPTKAWYKLDAAAWGASGPRHPYAITRACSARLSLTTRPFSLLCRP